MFGLAGARAAGVVPPRPGRAASGVVGVIAGLFAVVWLASIIPALISGLVPQELAETGLVSNPVHVLDLALILPAMLGTAFLARRGRLTAQFLLAPWLVFAALMGASIIAVLLLSAAPPLLVGLLALVTGVSAGTGVMTLRRRTPLGAPQGASVHSTKAILPAQQRSAPAGRGGTHLDDDSAQRLGS